MVRADLGPDAAVLHTREVQPGMMRWLGATRQIEVMATSESSSVPSRIVQQTSVEPPAIKPSVEPRRRFRSKLAASATGGMNLLGDATGAPGQDAVTRLYETLLAQQWSPELANDLMQRLLHVISDVELDNERLLHARAARLVEDDLPGCCPLQMALNQRRVVALVGPTGVGKTTTIAKLAANFRIRQRKRVGLITVDTYRVAAVDQLRTYADIIDLPMAIVGTPAEMRGAMEEMADLDLVLIDTAGRSPRDAAKLHELRAMLVEARTDEVHLVLSTVASANSLVKTAEQFMPIGISSLLLTKLDEAHGLGHLSALSRAVALPFSYLTHGQNVPDDIAPAERSRLSRALVGLGPEATYA